MQTTSMTVEGTIASRVSHDLLLAMFDAGVSLGLGIAPERAASEEVQQLISQIQTRWFGELEAARAWRRSETPDLRPDEVPAWLRAAQEREQALGDCQPPPELVLRGAR